MCGVQPHDEFDIAGRLAPHPHADPALVLLDVGVRLVPFRNRQRKREETKPAHIVVGNMERRGDLLAIDRSDHRHTLPRLVDVVVYGSETERCGALALSGLYDDIERTDRLIIGAANRAVSVRADRDRHGLRGGGGAGHQAHGNPQYALRRILPDLGYAIHAHRYGRLGIGDRARAFRSGDGHGPLAQRHRESFVAFGHGVRPCLHFEGGAGRAGRNGQFLGLVGVVARRGGGAVRRRSRYLHIAVVGAVEADGERRLVAFGRRRVAYRQFPVVVPDGAGGENPRSAGGKPGVDRRVQPQHHGLVGFEHGVAAHRHSDGLRSFSRRERQHAAGQSVIVRAGFRRTRPEILVGDRHLSAAGGGQAHLESQRSGAAVALVH